MKKTTFILVIDILGYEELAKNILEKTGFATSHIRRAYFLNPLNDALSRFQSRIRYKQLTDNFLVYAYEHKTIFEIIKELSDLTIPYIVPMQVPLEIGIAKAELDEGIDPIDQDETIDILKVNILKYYRDHYRKESNSMVVDTFIVLTKDFYDSLSEDRQYLCKKIDYATGKGNNVEFYVAQPKMMQDVTGSDINDISKIMKFLDKIRIDNLWGYFELKVLIFRNIEAGEWLTQFIYIRFLDGPVAEHSFRTQNLILIHKSYNITQLSSVIDSMKSNEFQVRDFPSSSLAEIDGRMEYDFCGYINNYRIRSPADMFGVTSPSHVLLKGGKSFSRLRDSEMSMLQDLRDYDQMSPIVDATRRELNLGFWDITYSAFFVAIAPLPMQMPRIAFNANQMEIRIWCAENINPVDLEVNIIGRIGNINTNLRVHDNGFVRIAEDIVYNTNLDVGNEDGALVDLYYRGNQFDNCYVRRNI